MVRVASLILGLLLSTPVAVADPAPSASAPAESPASPAERAGDDALQRLLDSVWSLAVVSDGLDRSVAGLLAPFPQAERQLRQAIATERQVGNPREIRPGIVAVDTSIAAERLGQLLTAVLQHHAGASAPRRVSLSASAGPLVSVGGLSVEDGRARSTLPGWRHCLESDLIKSQQAAQVELHQRVLAWLQRVPTSSGQTLGHLARQHPELDRALREQAGRASGQELSFEPDGTCVAACVLGSEQLTTMVRTALSAAGSPEIRPQSAFQSTRFEGISTAPPSGPPRAARLPAGPRPQWADTTLSKKTAAAGPPDEPDASIRNELAVKAARVEAQRQLWMELEQLMLPDGRSVAEAIAAHPDHPRIIRQISSAIFVMSKPSADKEGVATITMAIRLESVWQILGR